MLPARAAEKAGLRSGDRLLRWERGSASGLLRSPFDLTEVELEQGPRGPVKVSGLRGADPVTVSLFPDDWGLETRPTAASGPDAEAFALLQKARAEASGRHKDAAVAALQEALSVARTASRPEVEAQLLTTLGAVLREADDYDAAGAALDTALALRRRLGADTLAAAAAVEPLARLAFASGKASDADRKQVEQAVAAVDRLAPDSLTLARLLQAAGWLQGPPDGVESFARASALVERLSPDSILMATVLRARAFTGLPDKNASVQFAARSVSILERLAPESGEMVTALSTYAIVLQSVGDLAAARRAHERALAVVERTAAGSTRHGNVLNNLGGLLVQRGDLAEAEKVFLRALEIDERAGLEYSAATRLYNLGDVALRAREFGRAEPYLRRALEVAERHDADGRFTGRILYALARVLRERKQPEQAAAVLRRSMELLAKTSSRQLVLARDRLAELIADAGRHEEAEALLMENLEQVRKEGATSAGLGDRHRLLGQLALRRGRHDEAERHLRIALESHRRSIPGTDYHSEASHDLGVVARERGRKEEALLLFEEAVEALEAQAGRLGGSEEARARFRAHFQPYYRDLEELLIELGRREEAFEAVERSRARGLLALLASRSLALPDAVPAELQKARQRADQEHDRVRAALNAGALEESARRKLVLELEQARRAQEEARARIRANAPRAMAFRDPEPLGLPGVRAAIEPGTLLVVYSLGDRGGRIYAVGPEANDFAVSRVAATREAVRGEVQAYREAIHAGRGRLGRAALDARARRLTDLLLRPLADRLRKGRRLVIVPDGPLHLLPFAALHDPASPGRRHLVETRSVVVASSATLYDTLTRAASAASAATVVGFGDPLYDDAPGETQASATVERALNRGLRLTPLPASRDEVAALRSLSPQARLWLGPDATEERAKGLGSDARVVHFACHGFLDEEFPLESGLALATPGATANENGMLQAWEIFESVRLDADLVTLSACQTGLGQDMAGEGLLGLTWAFQYAGARSVIASLWEVNDASTADLMRAFYGHLAAGVPRPEALRRAQVALLRRPATAAPYYWAAFTLNGAAH